MARIDPLPDAELPEGVPRFNIFTTLARNPELFKAWTPYGTHLSARGRGRPATASS